MGFECDKADCRSARTPASTCVCTCKGGNHGRTAPPVDIGELLNGLAGQRPPARQRPNPRLLYQTLDLPEGLPGRG